MIGGSRLQVEISVSACNNTPVHTGVLWVLYMQWGVT